MTLIITLLSFTLIASLSFAFWIGRKYMGIISWKQQYPETTLVPIYQDSKGNRWYEHENPLKMPAYRGIAAEIAINAAEMNVTRTILIKWLDEIVILMEKGLLKKAFGEISKIQERLNMVCEEETILELATCYFMLEGEPVDTIDESFKKRKLEILRTDREAQAFFLQRALKLTYDYESISGADILKYLADTKTPERESITRKQQSTTILSTT